MSDMRPHYLYRCFDADGFLIYIGCTTNPRQRLGAHRRGSARSKASAWLSACMASHAIDGPFPGLEAGRLAEREAIRAEDPLFNTNERDRGGFSNQHAVARYLVSRGHLELAERTLCRCDLHTESWCYVHDRPNAVWVEIFGEDFTGLEEAS